ncbi:hypothetical protein LTR36_002258 [Oleoguttula mirabilis]|uniref:Uncharacterized protein n=1 Tax=Oleoguttula mirabilis TaxID=1507867 RepID=A0AAV9JMF8_9PEZI|nr:hypothetical protein LTR36_002258 [Oleoguttula mirabilis]
MDRNPKHIVPAFWLFDTPRCNIPLHDHRRNPAAMCNAVTLVIALAAFLATASGAAIPDQGTDTAEIITLLPTTNMYTSMPTTTITTVATPEPVTSTQTVTPATVPTPEPVTSTQTVTAGSVSATPKIVTSTQTVTAGSVPTPSITRTVAITPVATTLSTIVKPDPNETAASLQPVDTGAPSWVLGDDPDDEDDDCAMEMHIGTVPWPNTEYRDQLPNHRVCVYDPESLVKGDVATPEVMAMPEHQKCRIAKTVAISPAKPGCKKYDRTVTAEEGIEKGQDYLNASWEKVWRPNLGRCVMCRPNDVNDCYPCPER